MLTRLATGLVLAPLLVWLLVSGPLPAIAVTIAIAAALATRELLSMFAFTRGTDRSVGAGLAGLVAASPMLPGRLPFAVWMVANVAALGLALRKPENLEIAARRAAITLAAIAYVGGMAAAMAAIATHKVSAGTAEGAVSFARGTILMMFVIVFAGDTGAYFAGRTFGRHKLNELISPKKTIEGTIGGLIASTFGAWVCMNWLLPAIDLHHALALGFFCGATGQIGDLAESLFKRATGSKDSGTLLPGHGGMLDRIDGVLFAAPVFYLYLLVAH